MNALGWGGMGGRHLAREREGEEQTRQMEMSRCNAISVETKANPTQTDEDMMPVQNYTEQGKEDEVLIPIFHVNQSWVQDATLFSEIISKED